MLIKLYNMYRPNRCRHNLHSLGQKDLWRRRNTYVRRYNLINYFREESRPNVFTLLIGLFFCLSACLSVCLSVCLSLYKITQKAVDECSWNFEEWYECWEWYAFWSTSRNTISSLPTYNMHNIATISMVSLETNRLNFGLWRKFAL